LRGCIGIINPTSALLDSVIEAAESSAFKDPRFPPVQSEEIKEITIEVSVLTPPELIKVDNPLEYSNHINVGRDGLIIGKGWRKGLLLPQVPIEWGWDSIDFLSQCCIKAGLSPNEWKNRETEVYKFQAIIFKEDNPNGNISRHIIETE
jgi:uncharacterized protein (TIGR00296 family)